MIYYLKETLDSDLFFEVLQKCKERKEKWHISLL